MCISTQWEHTHTHVQPTGSCCISNCLLSPDWLLHCSVYFSCVCKCHLLIFNHKDFLLASKKWVSKSQDNTTCHHIIFVPGIFFPWDLSSTHTLNLYPHVCFLIKSMLVTVSSFSLVHSLNIYDFAHHQLLGTTHANSSINTNCLHLGSTYTAQHGKNSDCDLFCYLIYFSDKIFYDENYSHVGQWLWQIHLASTSSGQS